MDGQTDRTEQSIQLLLMGDLHKWQTDASKYKVIIFRSKNRSKNTQKKVTNAWLYKAIWQEQKSTTFVEIVTMQVTIILTICAEKKRNKKRSYFYPRAVKEYSLKSRVLDKLEY